ENRMDRFLRNRPPTFKGKFDPDGAQEWLDEIERIFQAMTSTDPQKVRLV
ncbi:putative Ty3/Gypsy polyprotein/retrotransposon, partial [Trifolium medium]|nr:putative Ty3/Gypsy polyprotein/retrotransposon [Trifolium medium]